jgi:hypothetical protein
MKAVILASGLRMQVEFSEPMVLINTDAINLDLLDWSEPAAWDELVAYYRATFGLR